MQVQRGRRETLMSAAVMVLAATIAGCTGSSEEPVAPAAATRISTSSGTGSESGTGPGGTVGSDTAAVSSDLDRALNELVAMPGGPPAVAAVVQIGDERTFHSSGVADTATNRALSIDDHMRIASVAKAFSGATALSLVDQGVLALDDTIGKLLPDLPLAWAGVTLRQLLNHTSGLPDFLRSPNFAQAAGTSLDSPPEPAALLGFAKDEPLEFPSGTRYQYSNSDNIAVGLMIESAAGKPYEEVLAAEVLDPIGLAGTSLPRDASIPEPVLHGYATTEEGSLEDVTDGLPAGWAWASGGIVSTPADLNDFIRAYVSGKLFGDQVRAEQQDLFIPDGPSGPPAPGLNSASMALFRYQTPCGTVYGHTGNTVGYTQLAVASPDGTRSATMSITLQRTDESKDQAAAVYQGLQAAQQAAICLALNG
jgi:D-alanyl-D-alanine carboxypeptidase